MNNFLKNLSNNIPQMIKIIFQKVTYLFVDYRLVTKPAFDAGDNVFDAGYEKTLNQIIHLLPTQRTLIKNTKFLNNQLFVSKIRNNKIQWYKPFADSKKKEKICGVFISAVLCGV